MSEKEEFAILRCRKGVYKVKISGYSRKCNKVIKLPDGTVIDPTKLCLEFSDENANDYEYPRLMSTDGANPIIYPMYVVSAEILKY